MFEFLFGPDTETVQRSEEEQRRADALAAHMALYHFDSCPYCRYVRRLIKSLGVDIELRDIHTDPEHLAELLAGGGRQTVPCLRIEDESGEVRWQYESLDIKDYLIARFGVADE